jgi:hypothetical protein
MTSAAPGLSRDCLFEFEDGIETVVKKKWNTDDYKGDYQAKRKAGYARKPFAGNAQIKPISTYF